MKLTILHTNDTHSYLEGFGQRACLINKIKREKAEQGVSTLLLDAGDVFSGDIYFNIYQGKKEAELLNQLHYDAMTFGNHEFDGGSALLADFLTDLHFPLVSSNVHFETDRLLAPLAQSGKVVPYLIKETETGRRIGIIGLTIPTTVEDAYPSAETVFDEPFAVARQMVAKLKALGADEIVLISHLGDAVDVKLAADISGIQVIVGGHTHVLLESPLMVNGTAIVQAGCYGEYLGELDLEFSEETGEILSAKEVIHRISDVVETEPALASQMAQIRKDRQRISSEEIVTALEGLNGEKEALAAARTNLGSLVADAYFEQAVKDGFRPDLAVMNSGGIRTSLPKGKVTKRDVIKILPFSKRLTVLEVSGVELLEALEYGLFPQVSHLHLVYDLKRVSGKHLLEAELVKAAVFQKIQPELRYVVATNSFVGAGKDDFRGFKKAKVLAENLELDVDLLADFLKSLPQPVNYEVRARIEYL